MICAFENKGNGKYVSEFLRFLEKICDYTFVALLFYVWNMISFQWMFIILAHNYCDSCQFTLILNPIFYIIFILMTYNLKKINKCTFCVSVLFDMCVFTKLFFIKTGHKMFFSVEIQILTFRNVFSKHHRTKGNTAHLFHCI